jgi:hypothetical protein
MAEKPTYLSEVLAGRATRSDIEWWVSAWHDADTDLAIDEYLGLTPGEYAASVAGPEGIDAILKSHGWTSPDVMDTTLFRMRHDVSAEQQQNAFQNATLSTIDGMAISISVQAPKGLDYRQTKVVNDLFRATFRRLVDVGCIVEIQVGPDDADTDEAKKVDEIHAMRGDTRG